jgi:hypothetical protein
MLKIASALPSLLVSPEGRFLDIVGYEAMIDRLMADDPPGPQRDAVAAMMKSPKMVAALKQRSAEFWYTWVGLWAEHDLAPGDKASARMRLPAFRLQLPSTIEHAGREGSAVRLRFSAAPDGKTDRAEIAGAIDGMIDEVAPGQPRKGVLPRLDVMRFQIHAEVLTEPRTLRPRSATYDRELTVKQEGKETSSTEHHEYRFDWGPTGK